MKYKTRISKIENNDITIINTTLTSLIKNGNFAHAIFVLLSGREPAEKEAILFEKLLISVIDHGMGTPSAQATRFIASGGNTLNVAVGGGLLSCGKYHGGAGENAMKQFYAWQKLEKKELNILIEEMMKNKEVIFGFGHKQYKKYDPRVIAILEEVKNIGFQSKFLYIKDIIESTFEKIKGTKIPLNIDGLLALFLCDFGFDPLVGKGFFLIGRTPGLVAQGIEEITCEKPFRRVNEEEIEFIRE